MASLQNEQIDLSYQGLIKTTDNAVLTSTGLKVISDGLGNPSPLKLSQQEVHMIADGINGEIYIKAKNALLVTDATTTHGFQIDPTKTVWSGNVDFQYATVTGLPDSGVQSVVAGTNVTVDNTDPANPIVNATGGGAAGLVAGTGLDSMKSADSLTSVAANATAADAIAIGQNARVPYGQTQGIAIGKDANVKYRGISIGSLQGANYGNYAITIGALSSASYDRGIVLGYNSTAVGRDAIIIGANSTAGASTMDDAIVLGANSSATVTGAVAVGTGVAATTVNTVTIKKLQMLDYATLDYADDTAAATGGIPLGGVYHTSGALKIRVA